MNVQIIQVFTIMLYIHLYIYVCMYRYVEVKTLHVFSLRWVLRPVTFTPSSQASSTISACRPQNPVSFAAKRRRTTSAEVESPGEVES